MAFKMNRSGFSFGEGTGRNSPNKVIGSAVMQDLIGKATEAKKAKAADKKFADAKKQDPNLSKYIAERSKHKKGTPEYNAAQNQINKAYGVSKRHGETTETKSGKGGKVKQTVTKTPGISEKKESTQKRGNVRGNVRVTEQKDLQTGKTTTASKRGKTIVGGAATSKTETDAEGNVTSRTKERYGKDITGAGDTGDYHSGRRKKKVKKTYKEDGTVTITRTKDKKGTSKTKTRRQILKGVGDKLGVGKGDIRKQRRIDRRANK
tara:strand:- start:1534 stop:2322 length:789 start_codon:yes stop_codon:yes gene_type:complete